MPNLIEIFRGGTHTDMRGTTLAFGESEIAGIAAAYDPALSEAPIVIGHPRADAPAYGWVKALSARGDRLYAEPDQVDAAFAELVESGRYKKVSACFYRPTAPANPKPGAYYLRHVGFLGAQPPAVKGLAPVAFAESPEDDLLLVEFADHESVSLLSRVLSLFRGVRDYIVERDGAEKADAVIPNGVLESMKEQATVAMLLPPAPEPAYNEENVMPDDKETVPPMPPAASPDELARRVFDLEAREAAFAERQRRVEAEAVVTAAVREGRLTPAQSEGLAAFMATLSESDTVAFSEGGKEKELSPVAFMKTFLSRLPVQVEFAEKSAGADDTIDGLSPLDAANRAVAYQERMKRDGVVITTTEALSAVKAGKDKGAQ